MLTNKEKERMVMKVSFHGLLVNIVLSVGKILAGLISRSGAMVSDGIHSASDVFSTLVVMIGYQMSAKEADERHPYGHERIECVAALILAMVLFLTGGMIGYQGFLQVISNTPLSTDTPKTLAILAGVCSILIKEGMYWYTKRTAELVGSGAMMADAWHHRTDAFSSVGSLIGIGATSLGYPLGDPLASMVISVCIVKASLEIFIDAVNKMLDTACDEHTSKEIEYVILSQEGVLNIDHLQTRLFGSRIYVDVEIGVQEDLSLRLAHDIADMVHDAIEKEFADVKHCMVHVNPKAITI